MKHILLTTPGVDSFVGYWYLKRKISDIIPVYFDLGSRYSKIEIQFVKKNIPDVIVEKVCDVSWTEQYDAYVPARNVLLATMVCNRFDMFDEMTIYFNSLKGDSAPDSTQDVFDLLSLMLSRACKKRVEVKSSFDFKFTKSEIVELWKEENNEINNIVTKTFSCYNPVEYQKDPHCYSCAACFRRAVALQDIQFLPFKNKNLVINYLTRALNNDFSEDRQSDIVRYCKKILEEER